MKDLLEICCGLDVHKNTIVACILSGPTGKTAVSEIRDFPTFASGLTDLRDWILSRGCLSLWKVPASIGSPSMKS